jgi:hypothetical protein
MNLTAFCEELEQKLDELFFDLRDGAPVREDSRAFGAMIEKRITDNWDDLCTSISAEPVPTPGRRTIYDFACTVDGQLLGFDVKTKDLDSTRYSDGGVCAVGNLFKFLANDLGIFVVVEVAHQEASEPGKRRLEDIKVAPFHLLPEDTYRIENLGTGQVRLNYSITETQDRMNWERSMNEFYDIFGELAIKHYERVKKDADSRANLIRTFLSNGYQNFRL